MAGEVLVPEGTRRERHGDVVDLTEKAHLGAPRDGDVGRRHPGLREERAPLRLQVVEEAIDRPEVQLAEHPRERGDELEADRRHQEPRAPRRPQTRAAR